MDRNVYKAHVTHLPQDMMTWFYENNIEYIHQTHLKRVKYIFQPRTRKEAASQFENDGYDLIFKNKNDLTLFLLTWDHYLKKNNEGFNIRKQ